MQTYLMTKKVFALHSQFCFHDSVTTFRVRLNSPARYPALSTEAGVYGCNSTLGKKTSK